MARMIPTTPPDHVKSKAENKLFMKIRGDLSNSWTALHSLGLGNHRFKPWAEIDFVLVGPLGVFCIEVKGGRVGRKDGEWTFQDGKENIHVKREGPFEQAGGACAALFKFLQERLPDIKTSVVGFGVATPDVVFQIDAPDVIKAVVFDERDSALNFTNYIERIAAYWTNRVHGSPSKKLLEPRLCERIVEQLRPDFDLEPTLRCQMRDVENELVRLTNEQYQIVDALATNPRVIIRGGAGTGKSLLALRESRRIAAEGGKVLLCCFNRQLAQYLSFCLRDCANVTVKNLHAFMADVVARAGTAYRLPAAEPSDLFSVFYPELCMEALVASEEDSFDALIIDEGQDLLKLAYVDVC